ncbi:MAG: hypothetical protein K6C99_10445 [Lachnospiraceae bacterium]|nr:hypothetical protein [Lachnospiraceae bacterium]
MKKQWIWGCIAFVIFISLSGLAIKMANDRAGKKTEFRYVCYIDSGNYSCELSKGFFDLNRIGSDKHPIYDAEQKEDSIIFHDIAYDGELPTEVNCWMDFIIDGENVSCGVHFYRLEECKYKEWKGDIILKITRNGNNWEIIPECTNCERVELRNQFSDSEGQAYDFNVYQ